MPTAVMALQDAAPLSLAITIHVWSTCCHMLRLPFVKTSA